MIKQWSMIYGPDTQVVLFFGLFGLMAGMERLWPWRRASSFLPRQSTNLLLTGLNIGVLMLMPLNLIGVATWVQSQHWGLLNQFMLPVALEILANLLLRGLISFFTHWLMHQVPWLWQIHRVHHLDTELDVTSTVRFHPLEFVVTLPPSILLVGGLGLTPWVLVIYELLDIAITLFSHANISISPSLDRALRYLIVTPHLHRVHHSAWTPETNSNYGAVFPIWDLLLGTYRTKTRKPQHTMELGLTQIRDQRTNQVIWLLQSPWLQRLKASKASCF